MAPLVFIYTFTLVLSYNAILCDHFFWSDKQLDRVSTSSENDPEQVLPYIRGEKPIASEIKPEKTQEVFEKLKEVKEAEVFLGQMLRVLQQYFARKLPQDKSNPNQSDGKPSDHQNIAWSYYDDVGK